MMNNLTGNRVYRGGMPNPHSGTLDPTGYVEREMRNQVSERRSGLAATALKVLQQRQGQNAPQNPGPEQNVNANASAPPSAYARMLETQGYTTTPTGQIVRLNQ